MPTPYSLHDLQEIIANDKSITVIDTRNKETFSQGFIPGAVFLGLDNDNMEDFAALILPAAAKILLVTQAGKEIMVAIERFTKTGYDVTGYLEGGFETWQAADLPTDMIIDIEVDELAMDIPFDNKMVIIDARSEEEFEIAHVKNAVNIPLPQFTDKAIISNFEEDENLYIYCGGGYRSLIAASLLKKENFHNLRNILGGFKAIKENKSIILDNK